MTGRKVWSAGDILNAADVNDYLMDQTVMVFADSTARASSLGTAATEGMVSYLRDINELQVWNGSWVSTNSLGGTVAGSNIIGAMSSATLPTANLTPSYEKNSQAQTLTSDDQFGQIYIPTAGTVTITIDSNTNFDLGGYVDIYTSGAVSFVKSGLNVFIRSKTVAAPTSVILSKYGHARVTRVENSPITEYYITGDVVVS